MPEDPERNPRLEARLESIADRAMQDADDAIVEAGVAQAVGDDAVKRWFGDDFLDAYREWMDEGEKS